MNTTTAPAGTHIVAAEHTAGKRRYARAGLVAGVGAAVATSAIAAIVDQFDVKLEAQGEAFPALAFAQVALVGAIIGVGLAALFTRRASRPRRTFVVTTVVLTIVSFLPPLLIGASAATVLVLELMHIVAAAIVIPSIASRLSE